MRIYLAGPMRGYPYWNFGGFDRAEAEWTALGHEVVSPANLSRAAGMPDPPEDGSVAHVGRSHLKTVIGMDLQAIMECDAVALLPGWERSAGATVELALAQFLGLEVFDAETKERVYPTVFPWQANQWDPRPSLAKRNNDAHQNTERQHGLSNVGGWDQVWRDTHLYRG